MGERWENDGRTKVKRAGDGLPMSAFAAVFGMGGKRPGYGERRVWCRFSEGMVQNRAGDGNNRGQPHGWPLFMWQTVVCLFGSVLFADGDFDAAVLGAAFGGGVAFDGLVFTLADSGDAVGRDAFLDKHLLDVVGTVL